MIAISMDASEMMVIIQMPGQRVKGEDDLNQQRVFMAEQRDATTDQELRGKMYVTLLGLYQMSKEL